MNTPALGAIKRTDGIAGHYQLNVPVTYPGEETRYVGFLGSTYGAPVIMITEHGQTRVTDWTRHGDTLNEEWVRRFFA